MTRERGAGRGRVSFVEDQVDDVEDRVESPRQLGAGRYLIRNSGVANLRLGPDDALGDGAGSGQIRVRDFLGRQAAHFAERERDLRIGGQRRVAAGENEPQAVVFERVIVDDDGIDRGLEMPGELRDRCVESRAPAQHVDRFEAAGRNEPRERVGGQPVARPPLDRRRERFVQRLFRQVEITDQANQRGKDTARVGAIQCLDAAGNRRLAQLNTSTGLTSTEPVRADGIRDATCIASLRSRASII